MSSKIEQLIDEIEEFIDGCKYKALSNTHIIVDKEQLDEMLRELRVKTPEEIKRYQKIINNKDAILADAREKAATLINEATVHTNELINEHEIMQRAIEQANAVIADASAKAQQIVDRAVEDAGNIRLGAIQYTDDMLGNLQMIIEHSLENNKAKYDALISSLNKDLHIVVSNRKELRPEPEAVAAEEALAANVKEMMSEED